MILQQVNLPIWNFQSPIHIDDSPASPIDWAWAETQPWCTGSGTFSDPYIIDGLNITARRVGTCILIGNSSKYFIVRNCKLIESGFGIHDAGIHLDHVENGKLINNNCSFNRFGISLYYSDNNNVSRNTVINNQGYGINLYLSGNNTVSGNTANNNQNYGIYISHSDENNVDDNEIIDNSYGIYISRSDNTTISGNIANNNQGNGIFISFSYNTTVSGNTANNNSIFGIRIFYSDNAFVSGNTVNNNQNHGIYIYYSDNNTVSGNTVNNNRIYLFHSHSATVSGNTVDNNGISCIYLFSSNYNLIYKNCFLNNGIHATDEGNFNEWDNGTIGNYWDDYLGYDDNFDGIGDIPYIISGTAGSQDNYPIWTFQSPIHIDDSPASPINWAWAETQPWCSGSGTFSEPYIIDGLNITARGVANGILIENSNKYFIVQNCKLFESGSGDYDAGIHLNHVGNGTIINNNCSFNNNYGIYLDFSDNNTVSGNTANNNSNYGIYLLYSDNNIVSGNTAIDNKYYGIYLLYSDCTTVSGNTANNNSNHGIVLYYSNNTTISRNTANHNRFYGIDIYSSDNNTVSGNTANHNKGYGIGLFYSNSTTISGNIVDNNVFYGIYLLSSDYNLIYKNYFINNGIQARDSGNSNDWDNGTIGNYWDDYAGVDANDDGIGDTPYLISGIGGGQDTYPIWTDGDDITPIITIISPLFDNVFGLDAPNYQITIVELNLDTIWYTLDGGATNYTITGLTGTFNQLAWEALSEGSVTIRFYANDIAGNIGFTDVEVIIEIPEDVDALPIISFGKFGNYYILFTFLTILSFIILEKRKKK
jgi:parallel beta-helix repeat protein